MLLTKVAGLDEVGKVGKQNTGTTVRFWPDPQFFDSVKFSLPALKHVLRAKAVLCPGLLIRFFREGEAEHDEWCFEDGLRDYLVDEVNVSANRVLVLNSVVDVDSFEAITSTRKRQGGACSMSGKYSS